MDTFFPECIGPVFNMGLMCRRQALRVSSAETRLAVYSRRLVSGLDVFFSDCFLAISSI